MQGTIHGGNLAETLRRLIAEKRSGLLYLKRSSEEKGLYFAAGRIVSAESNGREDSLGYSLLDEGLLSPQALEAAMRQVVPGRLLADVIADAGTVAPADLQRTLEHLASRIVVSVFDWTEGSYFFQEGDFSFKGTLPLPTASLAIEGVRRMFDFDGIRSDLLADPRPLLPSGLAGGTLTLEPTEGFILSRVDGSLSVSAICNLSIVSEEMTCRVLYGLMVAGIIGYDSAKARSTPPPPPRARSAPERVAPSRSEAAPDAANSPLPAGPSARQATMGPAETKIAADVERLYETIDQLNLFAVLGLGREAPTSAIEAAYRTLSERFHPSRNTWLTDDTMRSKLVFVFARIKAAYETLRGELTRTQYDEQLRRRERDLTGDTSIRMEFTKTDRQREVEEIVRESEALYKEAEKLFEAQRFHDALQRVKKAIELYPREARFFGLAGRIEMLNPNMRWQKDAETHLRQAIELDPWAAGYRVGLGLVYKNAGLKHKAKREFIRALELDASNEAALSEVPPAERPVKKTIDMPPPLPPPSQDDEEVDWS